jgi:hypothetical protein
MNRNREGSGNFPDMPFVADVSLFLFRLSGCLRGVAIPYWPQAQRFGLPGVKYTARDVCSGLLFWAFAQRARL